MTTEVAGASEASACVCKPGYGYIDGVCQQCPANFYKSGFNLQQCQACHAHSVATAGAASAHDCTCGSHEVLQVASFVSQEAVATVLQVASFVSQEALKITLETSRASSACLTQLQIAQARQYARAVQQARQQTA